jgi:hypothetical protein
VLGLTYAKDVDHLQNLVLVAFKIEVLLDQKTLQRKQWNPPAKKENIEEAKKPMPAEQGGM